MTATSTPTSTKTPASTKAPSRFLASVTALVLTLIWGSTWAVIVVSLQGFPPMKGLSIRFVIGSAILFAVAWSTGVRFGRQRHEAALWILQTLCTFVCAYGLVYWAEQWVPSGLTAVLFSTNPLFVVLFAYFLLPGERLGTLGLLGMLAGFCGVAVIFSDDLSLLGGAEVRFAALVLLIAPITVAFAEVVIKRWGRDVPALSMTALPMGAAAALIAGLALVFEGDRPITLAPAPIAALLYLAVFGSAVAFGLFFWLLKHVSVIQISLISYGVPIIAVGIGTVLLDEPLTVRMAVGAVLVIGGAALVVRRSGGGT